MHKLVLKICGKMCAQNAQKYFTKYAQNTCKVLCGKFAFCTAPHGGSHTACGGG